ncbi:hypothetical protein D3C77_318280 [compost metagenome]
MGLHIFAKEFNEEYWLSFYKMSQIYFDSLPDSIKTSLDSLGMQEDIKTVLIYRLKNNAKSWLNTGLPLLDGIKPLNLLDSVEGTNALKEILLRMPD